MEQDSLRALSTLLLFIAFIGLCIRVYSRKNKAYYEEAANLPFVDDDDNAGRDDDSDTAVQGSRVKKTAANPAGESNE
ncbi:MAG: cbb3-type cytochrome c oxidase subunit 3 [Gammaproteobacteria bacterium]|nr:cbb3-type cytochrome c oxidase subunit 3 [Gammaproteobacteria bacterium]NND38469.1 cbb3-type cytochrome c oxidase subunit 3 [Pseudomonadales bacterium]MBT8150228.1 cbb3-type cytochrome c oxidase subunit 3 [Gammaproteobacteria bacterium]NNL11679.1 cbb3-type cytochrome c oxidase subunit 3 [Pseudomonadales bacterium]NNM11573.1 cbb3-type cytochrome c oxidase subunit 3 [Pseudomonadales bacterium]